MSPPVSVLDSDRRKALLEEVRYVLHPDRDDEKPIDIFLPTRAHGELLRDNTVLVVGERGAGKSAIFKFLSAVQANGWAPGSVIPHAPERIRWVEGFAAKGHLHPSEDVLKRWAAGRAREELERFWLGHLCGRMVEGGLVDAPPHLRFLPHWLRARNQIADWVDPLGQELGAFQGWLDRVDDQLAREGTVIFGYDDLDRLIHDGSIASAAPLVGALVNVWIALTRRHRALRARVFLRPDLRELIVAATTDASKLMGHTAELKWSHEDVFRVLLRRFGASEPLRHWLEGGDPPIRFTQDLRLGWLPPYSFVGTRQQLFSFMPQPKEVIADTPTQESLAMLLAGETMGAGTNKGYTHTWILNHSRDGLGRCLPRVTLNLIRYAAEIALDRDPRGTGVRLLSPAELESAQAPTGQQRIEELKEAHSVMQRLERLRDQKVPIAEADAIQRLGEAPHDDGLGADGRQILNGLLALGVITRRPPDRRNGAYRIDVPELFRRALGIRKHGGPLQLPAEQGAPLGAR